MISFLLSFLFLFGFNKKEPVPTVVKDVFGCRLEENLEGWNLRGGYQLFEKYISRDTLEYQFNPRYGMYINAVARVRVDTLNNSTGIVVEEIRLYGDPFESDKFKEYFILQYEAYVYDLVDKYPIKTNSSSGECDFLIHQQKIRACG